MQTRYSTTLITGASSGIGAELARQLAPFTKSLVLVARRMDRLEELAVEISAGFPDCDINLFSYNLAEEKSRLELLATLEAEKLSPDLLVNNAGLGDHGDISTSEWPRMEVMIDVNIKALLHLTHLLLPAMIASGSGTIVNISSVASLIPVPEIGVYAATKAFVTSFSEALRVELKGTCVTTVCICPGPIRTEFGLVAKRSEADAPISSPSLLMVPLDQAVAEMVRAIQSKRARMIPGLIPRLLMTMAAATPMPLLRFALEQAHKRRASGKSPGDEHST